MFSLPSMVSSARGKAVRSRSALSGLATLLGASSLLLLSGCGAQNGLNLAGTPTSSEGAGIQGKVYGGQNPIIGASVSLYAVGTGGYGTAPTLLAGPVSTVGPNGTFNISESSYSCPAAPGDQLLIIATGGNSGGGTNPNISLMSALGSCTAVKAGTPAFVWIDEVTTVASAYSLAQFLTYSSSIDTPPATSPAPGATPNIGIPTNSGAAPCTAGAGWQSNGAKTCNYIGLVNAMNTVPNLVNLAKGVAPSDSIPYSYYVSGAGDTSVAHTGYAPSARINTLADILWECVNTTGGTAGQTNNCGVLFSATSPSGYAAPTDTLQAILNLAQNPQLSATNNGNFYGLLNSNAPYQAPAPLTAAPNDWTLAMAYTGGGFLNAVLNTTAPAHKQTYASGLAIDALGNIWATSIGDKGAGETGFVAGFQNNGAPITNATTTTLWGGYTTNAASPRTAPAIDLSGNIWFANGSTSGDSFAAISSTGGASVLADTSLSTYSGGDPTGVAIDTSGNVWIGGEASENGTLLKFQSNGTPISLTNTYTYGSLPSFNNVSLDANGNVWLTTSGGDVQVSASSGAVVNSYANSANYGQLAVSSTGDVFGCNISYIYEDIPATPTYLQASSTGGCNAGSSYAPNALDGAGNLWEPVLSGYPSGSIGHLSEVSSTTGTTLSPASYGYQGIGAAGIGGSSDGESPSTVLISNGPNTTQNIAGIAVDQSGNVWVLNAYTKNVTSDQLVEFVGLGAPTVQPTVLALQNNLFTKLP